MSAYGAAAAAIGGCGTSGAAPEQVENLIIGSGFGGSITAYRLAMAGHSSVLLERGKRWTVEHPGDDVFCDMGVGEFDNRCAWLADRQPLPGIPASGRPFVHYTGVLEKIFGDGINIVCAAGVGGGSLVYSGMMVQPPQDLFDEVFAGTGVTWADMDATYYPRARAMMGTPTQLPDDIFNHPRWIATHTYLQQADAAGYTMGGTGRKLSDRLFCAFDWEGARMEIRGEIPEQLMRGSYIFGLNSGAKGTLDKFYLGMAEMSGMTEVRPLHWAQRIIQRPDGWLVEVDLIDTAGVVVEQRQILARKLFVCAGTANTTGLLLRAKSEQTIEGLPDAIGEHFGNNGQHIMARKGVGVDTLSRQAGPACAMIFDYDARIGMENGPAPLPYTNDMQILISTGQGIPDTLGSMTWDATMGKVVPHWSATNDATAHQAASDILTALNTTNGGTVATSDLLLGESITFHPLGGCVMGQATDSFGRVMGQTHLYVIDGSLIPGSTPCSNPFWTISANSERCIENIIANDFVGR
jgi:cholesterol oxidase